MLKPTEFEDIESNQTYKSPDKQSRLVLFKDDKGVLFKSSSGYHTWLSKAQFYPDYWLHEEPDEYVLVIRRRSIASPTDATGLCSCVFHEGSDYERRVKTMRVWAGAKKYRLVPVDE